MKSRDFCYWLQGFFELSNDQILSSSQLKMIQDHLKLVFIHEIDPSMGGKAHQVILDKIHSGGLIPDSGATMRC